MKSIVEKQSQKWTLLRCTHENTVDRFMFHLRPGVKVGKFKSVVIASPDTVVFVCFIHNYQKRRTEKRFGFWQGWVHLEFLCLYTKKADILESDVIRN